MFARLISSSCRPHRLGALRPRVRRRRARTPYRVQAGDTLWSIAARSYGGDPREGVWKLRERNHLAGTTIAPGQVLRLP